MCSITKHKQKIAKARLARYKKAEEAAKIKSMQRLARLQSTLKGLEQ